MEKTKLRDALFLKYFEIKDGINLNDFVKSLSYIPQTYQELSLILEQNTEDYDFLSNPQIIKDIEHNNQKYLIIKVNFMKYILIDLIKYKSLTKEQVKEKFTEDFFISNFQEFDWPNINRYSFFKYKGDIQYLINFYFTNKATFNLKQHIYYKVNINEAWSYISINLSDGKIQLGFQTKDQFLYEQLFLNFDLTPQRMQDATKKIGLQRMQEMFLQIKAINLPFDCIPKDIYEKYLTSKELFPKINQNKTKYNPKILTKTLTKNNHQLQ